MNKKHSEPIVKNKKTFADTSRQKGSLICLLALLCGLFFFSLTASAQKTDNEGGWEKVDSQMMQPGESIPARNLVGAAYGFIWVMVAGFVFTVWRRTGSVERELSSLRAQIEEAQKKKAAESR